jgi:hypothetical protein
MIGRILAEIRRGPTTVVELSRKLGVEQGALEQMLRFMARKGLIRELHAECVPAGCAGCPSASCCRASPVTGYELVVAAATSDTEQDGRSRGRSGVDTRRRGV